MPETLLGWWFSPSEGREAGAVHRTKRWLLVPAVVFAAGFVAMPAAQAAVVFDGSPGTASPPATLGPYSMTSFPADPQASDTNVGSVASPLGGSVAFSPSIFHTTIGDAWSTWSHGYTGDVYFTTQNANPDTTTLTLPAGTGAFYFYAEPEEFGVSNISATAQDGTTSGSVGVEGAFGAQYFGFYGTGGDTIASVTITADPAANGFAIGEFGIATSPFAGLLADSQGVGTGTSLADKVTTAESFYNAGDTADACGTLDAYIHEVNAQTGKSITSTEATQLIDEVNSLKTAIGC
jgi:hypothetical protein